MMRSKIAIALLLVLVMSASGCANKPKTAVRGQVVLGDASGYPVGTMLLIRVADVSARPAKQLAEQRQSLDPGWEAPGTHPPRDFEVGYDRASVAESDKYVVWAEARRGDELIAASTPVPVVTGGKASSGISLGLVPAAAITTASPLPLP